MGIIFASLTFHTHEIVDPAPAFQRYVTYHSFTELRLTLSRIVLGTIRSNLDPFSIYDDARLWDALRRSYLVDPIADSDPEKEELKSQNKTHYTLDSVVESDGANLSVGERSLLSLARALVKDSKVVGEFDPSFCHELSGC